MNTGRPTPPWETSGAAAEAASPRAQEAMVSPEGAPPLAPGAVDIFTPEIPPRRMGQTVGWVLASLAMPVVFLLLMIIGTIVGYATAAVAGAGAGLSPEAAVETTDAALSASIAGQVLALVVLVPLWVMVRRRAFGPLRRRPRGAAKTLLAVAGLAAAGLGVQLSCSYLLDFVLRFLPELSAEYTEIMEGSGISEFSLLSALTVAVLAPVVEEIACRGLVFEFLMRAMNPGWNMRTGAQGIEPTRGVVAAAIIITSVIFGLLHLNVVQSSYAIPMGILLSWVYWRTGSLWYSIGLHLVVNFSSYGVEVAGTLLSPLGPLAVFALSVAVLVVGVLAFNRGTAGEAAASGQAAV